MIGAILGDIAGSRYEFRNNRRRPDKLWTSDDFFTDDTVLTCATAIVLLQGVKRSRSYLRKFYVYNIRDYVEKFPNMSYGERFLSWIGWYRSAEGLSFEEWSKGMKDIEFNDSMGNGCAMKIAPVVYVTKSLAEARDLARLLTQVTHNHEDSLKAVDVLVTAMWYALEGKSRDEIRDYIVEQYPEVADMTYEKLRETYSYTELAKDTVPQALACFLDSKDFEGAVKNAVSIGGDADTLGAITGSLAEAFYKYDKSRDEGSKNAVYDARSLPKTVSRVLEVYTKSNVLIRRPVQYLLEDYDVYERLKVRR